ncbi:hypothetical protein EDB89DRAFT_1903387 [Lactarius sanguifluus]|nr:hypothetical protein EDB89DRAFT_1903387 [Lactarius sanguifluus]
MAALLPAAALLLSSHGVNWTLSPHTSDAGAKLQHNWRQAHARSDMGYRDQWKGNSPNVFHTITKGGVAEAIVKQCGTKWGMRHGDAWRMNGASELEAFDSDQC